MPTPDEAWPLGPGVRRVIGDGELVEITADEDVTLLRVRPPERALVVLHQAGPAPMSLLDEADRLLWLAGVAPAPEVKATGRTDAGDEAVVVELGALASTADEGHPMGPEALIGALADALTALHSRPVTDCPFVADATALRRVVDDRIARGLVPVTEAGPYAGRAAEELATIFDGLRAEIGDPEEPVFVHGALVPSRIWLDPTGRVSFLGWRWSGVGDRHLDLAAVATMLTELHGPALVAPFIEAYGFDRVDLRRLDAHQLLAHLLS